MNHRNLLLIILIIFMVGETLALWLGVVLLTPEFNSWSTTKNITVLMLDGICALVLLLTFILHTGIVNKILLLISLTLAGISHAYRMVEFFTPFNNPFCLNYPMLLVNTIKLLLIVVSFILNLKFSIHKN